MSNERQRMRRNSPLALGKGGPIKATLPFYIGGRKSNPCSPTLSWENRSMRCQKSPENQDETEQTDTMSTFLIKGMTERGEPQGAASTTTATAAVTSQQQPQQPVAIKRTLSVDSIHSPPPQQWSLLADGQRVHKETQTPAEWWDSLDRKTRRGQRTSSTDHKRSSSAGGGDILKEHFKQRLAKSNEKFRQNSSAAPRASPIQGSHVFSFAGSSAMPVPAPHIPKGKTRDTSKGSLEGLNQEIEACLVLKGFRGIDNELHFAQESLPDGHRAPIAELLQAAHAHKAPSCLHQLTRSVDTQTPSATEQVAPLGSRLPQQQPPLHDVMMAENLSPQQRDSSPAGGVFLVAWPSGSSMAEEMRSQNQGPIKSFIETREPPDGCERLCVEEPARMFAPAVKEPLISFLPIKSKPAAVPLIPSGNSAFLPLPRFSTQPLQPPHSQQQQQQQQPPQQPHYLSRPKPVYAGVGSFVPCLPPHSAAAAAQHYIHHEAHTVEHVVAPADVDADAVGASAAAPESPAELDAPAEDAAPL